MGKNYFFFAIFLRNPFLRRVLDQKLIFFAGFFFVFWGLGLIHFVATARNCAYLGLWDCSPFLHRHTNVDQLDSGIAVHSTDKHQQAWFRSTSVSEPALGTRPLVRTPSWSRAQGVLTPPSRAQPGEPPCGRVLFTLVWASGPAFPPGETLGPLGTNNQQTNLTRKKTGNPISRTSPFICFGAHHKPHSNMHVPN